METTRAKYDQLIQDLRGELRPQREWCEGRGLYMVIGHFVVGVAGGTWLFSLLYGNRAGLALAFVLGAVGGLLHLANLGHPGRAWKMMLQVRRSWISRGFFGLSFFLVGALLVLVPQFAARGALGQRLGAGGHRQRAGDPGDADHDRLHGICLHRLQGHTVLELPAASGAVCRLRAARGHCRACC